MATIRSAIDRFKKIAEIDLKAITKQAVSIETIRFARKQFLSHGGYGGKPWAFYGGEPKYLTFKEAMGALPLPLRWTDSMQRVYPALTNPNHPLRILRQSGNNVYLDINIPYLTRIETGGVNQFGERFPGRQIFPNQNKALQRDVGTAAKYDFYNKVRRT